MTAMPAIPGQRELTKSSRCEGKVVVVTGPAAGIGAADARCLAAEGAAVAVNDILGDAAKETVAQIIAAGGKAMAI